jgi:hypothetical protein
MTIVSHLLGQQSEREILRARMRTTPERRSPRPGSGTPRTPSEEETRNEAARQTWP